MQQLLVDQGYSVGPEGTDGLLGPNTHAGIVAFQADHGLATDGVPGPLTWAALTS
nr:peptidoglycan-binding domain-containing protein [Micromonospora sp. DSM 115978]